MKRFNQRKLYRALGLTALCLGGALSLAVYAQGPAAGQGAPDPPAAGSFGPAGAMEEFDPQAGGPGGGRMGQFGRQARRGGPGGGEQGQGRGGRGGMAAMALTGELGHFSSKVLLAPRFREQLALSEDQVKKIEDSDYATEQKVIEIDAKLRLAQLEMQRLMSAEKPDKSAVLKQIDQEGSAQTERRKLDVSRRLDIRETLTADQLKKVQTILQERAPDGPDNVGGPAQGGAFQGRRGQAQGQGPGMAQGPGGNSGNRGGRRGGFGGNFGAGPNGGPGQPQGGQPGPGAQGALNGPQDPQVTGFPESGAPNEF